jgi:cephalosporin hydroxylase
MSADIAASVAAYREIRPPLLKSPSDLARYEEIIRRLDPTLIIETGTGYGGSAAWFARLGIPVITIDNEPARCNANLPDNVVRIIGSSTNEHICDLIGLYSKGQRILCSLDSDHSQSHVAQELREYGAILMASGQPSYLVVEDTIFRHIPHELVAQGDPLAAIEQLWSSAMFDGWEVAEDIEDMFPDTQNPGGWLRHG